MKKFIWLPVLLFVFLIVISCGGRPSGARNIIIYENEGSTEELVLENEYLELRFLPQNAEIILTEKATGVQWRSNPSEHDPLADPITRYTQTSQFFLEYANVYGIGQTLFTSEHGVNHGAFSYDIVNNVLEVNYTVGNLDRTYVIPPAVPEERMLEFISLMTSAQRSVVNSGYRLYDIDNLRRDDNREELLALYPDLISNNIYVLRAATHDYQKAEYEVYFAEVGYTYEDYLEDVAHYPALAGEEKPAFNISLHYSLEGKSLVVDIPFEKIGYRTGLPITTLSVLPFMGAGGLDDEGYLLVPDGSGALIYFNNGRQNQQAFNSIVYGWDEGLVRNAVISDNRSPFPVYGIQKNGNALLCIIENGAAYASVRADVSMRNSSWNYVYPRFTMVHSEIMNISGRSQRDVYNYERMLPEGESITLRFVICDEDSYVGMAKEYRSYLLDRYPSLNTQQNNSVPVAVEILGAVNKTQHRLGIPFDLPLKLTSYNEAAQMIDDFSRFGWSDVYVKLNGWFNRGVEHFIPSRIRLINELGSSRDFNNLVEAAQTNGYMLYPEVDFFFMKDKKLFDGFNLYRDVSRYINRERIQRYPYSFIWFGELQQWGKLSYVITPQAMMSMIDNYSDRADNLGLQNIAFRNIGYRLAGDYNERQHVSREESIAMRQEKLDELHNSGTGIMLLAGYAYAAPFADFIVDMPLTDQGFGITDASVPFYPIVLHGLVPYTGRAINLAEDYTKNLLKTIESGAGLYFSFMTEEVAVLQETRFRQFYANEYDKWVEDANSLYRRFSADFGHLYNQPITGHSIISNGVTVTEYQDGTRVIVNAGDFSFNYNGRIINADSYIVLRRGE